MGDVVHVNFTDIEDHSGYIMGNDDESSFRGVFCGGLVASTKNIVTSITIDDTEINNDDNDNEDMCYIGGRMENGISYPVEISAKDLNEFCVMWLCIFNPDVIAFDDED